MVYAKTVPTPDEVVENVNKTAESLLLAPVLMTNKVAESMVKPIKPIIKNIDQLTAGLEKMRNDLNRVLFTTQHKNLIEAMIADVVDTIPFLGDITEVERLADAKRLGDKDAITAHGIDVVFGEIADAIPVVGEFIDSFLDALLPANTLLYLKRRGIIDWKPPLPPKPPVK